MAVADMNVYTSANRVTQAPNTNGIFFSKYLERSTGGQTDPFENFIGADGQMGVPIVRKTELNKGGGDLVYFPKHGAIMGKGSRGEEVVVGVEEKMRYGSDQVKVDFQRHGTGWTLKDLMKAAAGGSIPIQAAKELERWIGSLRCQFILQRLRGRAQIGHNVYFAGGVGTLNALASTNYFTTTTIEAAAGLLGQMLAKPIANAKSKRGAMIEKFLFFAPDTVFRPLYSDSAFTNQALYAQPREDGGNTLLDGGLSNWRGHGLFNWNAGDEDGNGPIGSFFNPKALLGTAITNTSTNGESTVVTFTGGGSLYTSGTDYFRFFPGNTAFVQYEGETITESAFAAASDYFLKVINVSGADAGKWGMYRFTGTANTGAVITTKAETGSATTGAGGRLAAATSGYSTTKLGDVAASQYVEWDATKNTEAHPIGSPVYLCNAKGQVLGFVGALGSNAVYLAYGGVPGHGSAIAGTKYDDTQDAGMKISAYISAVMGVDVSYNTQSKPRGYVLIPTVYTPLEPAL